VGASTGGFTDCLLQHGASKVFAIDVGKGILHWRLRNDPRVILFERTNARYLEELPEPIDLVSADASFISLKLLLGPISNWLTPQGEIICLIKPQFEAGRDLVERGGVVKDAEVHRQVIRSIADYAKSIGFHHVGLTRSVLKGPKGNVEFFLYCVRDGESIPLEDLIAPIFPEST
jgi:23S rRNA (cytidine1920-2'-O)/16S rRNA (cytidine1409-2'-O)-methyltransferase